MEDPIKAELRTKLVLIVCEQGVEPDVMDALEQLGLTHYTRWTDCVGAGETGKRQGTAIWPGLNTVIMIVMSEDLLETLYQRCEEIKDSFSMTPGLRIIVTDGIIM